MKRFYFLLILSLFTLSVIAQNSCSLSSSFAYDIKHDGEVFYFVISEPIDVHENYLIYVNQELQPKDGAHIGPFKADCETSYVLEVISNTWDDCGIKASIGTVCSQSDDCRIGEIEFSYPECNPNGVVYVDLDFQYKNVSDSFTVKGNGNFYGTFSYNNLPISVGPFMGNCDKEYEFEIQDAKIEGCKNAVEGIVICCPINCDPPIFEIVQFECSDGILAMKLKLVDDLLNDNIHVKLNEQYISDFKFDYPFIYFETSLPVTAIVNTVSVCSVGIADVCCHTETFSLDDCKINDECKIYDLVYSLPNCQSNEEVFIKLDFQYKNVASKKFQVRGNGINYGTFLYADLPVKVGPFQSACDVMYELKVFDSEQNDCGAGIENLYICCNPNCIEPVFVIAGAECTSAGVKVKLELLNQASSDNLLITFNDHIVPNYEYDFPYVTFFVQGPSAIENKVKVCTANSSINECCHVERFELDCNPSDECKIYDLKYEVPNCQSNEEVFIKLDFRHKNTSSDSFFVVGNGITYGSFLYSELPVKVGPFESACDVIYQLRVFDAGNADCSGSIDDLYICCNPNCIEPVFEIAGTECTNAGIRVKLKLLNQIPSDYLIITFNDQVITNYDYNYPYISFFIQGPGAIVNEISVCTPNTSFNECCHTERFELDCYPSEECKIYNLRYDVPECDGNEKVFIKLDFEYENTASETFEVRGNGINYGTFKYEALPVEIGPFQNACDVLYELKVYDSERNDCGAAIEDIYICCNPNCQEPLFEIISVACTGASVEMKVELILPLPSNSYVVLVNNQVVENVEVDFPYMYLRFENTGAIVNELTICYATGSAECCYSQLFELDCNPPGECKIGDLRIEPNECIAGDLPGFYINFEYENVGSEGFSLKGNGKDYGDFKYDQLPIFITVEDNCDTNYEFVVSDNEFNCSNFVEYGHYCCAEQCSFRIKDTRIRCNDGFITEVAFYLEEDTDPIKKYTVYVNGEIIGETDENNTFLEFETKIAIAPGEVFELTVCDIDCCVSERLDFSNCNVPPQVCEISNVTTSELSCSDNGLSFILNFDHEGTNSEKFDVYSLFGFFGSFEYADLPVKIKGFPSVNLGLNVLFVCDQGSFCCQAHLFTNPSCLNSGGGVADSDDISFVNDHRYIRQNPVNAELRLTSPEAITTYHVLDSSGRIVKVINATERDIRADVSDLHSGLYLIRIEHKGEIKIEKLIIAN